MTFEVGKEYLLRSGERVTVMQIGPTEYPWLFVQAASGTMFTLGPDGRLAQGKLEDGTEVQSREDIVAEVNWIEQRPNV